MRYKKNFSPLFSLYDFDENPLSIKNLPTNIVANNTSVSPEPQFNAYDIRDDKLLWFFYNTNRTNAKSLYINASAGDTWQKNNGSLYNGNVIDDGCVFNGPNLRYQAQTSDIWDIATEDIVLEIFLLYNAGTYFLYKGSVWYIYLNGTSVRIKVGSLDTIIANCIFPGSMNHILIFINRDENTTNGGNLYINGVLKGTFNPIAGVASASTAAIFWFNYNFTGKTFWSSLWKKQNWFAGGSQDTIDWNTIARDRFNTLTGFSATKAVGTPYPTYYSYNKRTHVKSIDYRTRKYKMYPIIYQYPSLTEHMSPNGRKSFGFVKEFPKINQIPWLAFWTNTGSLPLQYSPLDSINGLFATKYSESSGMGAHGAKCQIGNAVARNDSCTYSIFSKTYNDAYSRRYAVFRVASALDDNSGSFISCDLLNNLILYTGSSDSLNLPIENYGVEQYADGWGRYYFTVKASGSSYYTPQKPYCQLFLCNNPVSNSYSEVNYVGDSGSYLSGALFEHPMFEVVTNNLCKCPTGFLYTASPVVTTYTGDYVEYKLDDGNYNKEERKGIITYDVLITGNDVLKNLNIFSLGDATSNHYIKWNTVSSTKSIGIEVKTSGSLQFSATGTISIADGNRHSVMTKFEDNNIRFYIDSTLMATSSACLVPNITKLIITSGSATETTNLMLTKIKIYKYPSDLE